MVNSSKGYPHLAVGQHVSILEHKTSEVDGLVRPADIEVRKQEVNAPLMIAVDSAP